MEAEVERWRPHGTGPRLVHVARVHPDALRRLVNGGKGLGDDADDLGDFDGLGAATIAVAGKVCTACRLAVDENVPEGSVVLDATLADALRGLEIASHNAANLNSGVDWSLNTSSQRVHLEWRSSKTEAEIGEAKFVLAEDLITHTGLENVNLAAAVRRRLRGLLIVPGAVYACQVLGVVVKIRAMETCPSGFLGPSSRVSMKSQRGEMETILHGEEMSRVVAEITSLVKLKVKGHPLAPAGALLCGPLGSGKSLCLEALQYRLEASEDSNAESNDVEVTLVDCASLLLEAGRSSLPPTVGPRGAKVHVLLIDDLDALVSLRDEDARQERSRVTDWICRLLTGPENDSDLNTNFNRHAGSSESLLSSVFVLATCADTRVNELPARLVSRTNASAFPLRMQLTVPSLEERTKLVHGMLYDQGKDTSIAEVIAKTTAGFVAGDLARLCNSWEPTNESQQAIVARAAATKPRALVSAGDVQEAQRAAAAMPDMAGYVEVRERLTQLIQWQWLHPEATQRLGAQPPTGILLYGPSGCGKTFLAHKMGQASACNFLSIKSSDLVSKYVGESERLIRDLFSRARHAAPCILFFDELDSIATRRDLGSGGEQQTSASSNRVLATFLNELDGIDTRQGLLVVGACSREDALDAALLRPGRLGTSVLVHMPRFEDRRAILATMRTPWSDDVDLDEVAERLEGCSCADVRAANTEAVLAAMREAMHPEHGTSLVVTRAHLEVALQRIQESKNTRSSATF